MKKIVIIGGGASGLVAAITSKNSDNEIIVIEKNKSCGKKILVTGNGKCNFWNKHMKIDFYNSSNKKELAKIINDELENVIPFFESLGLVYKEKNDYYYPFSNQAVTIKNILEEEALKRNVKIVTETKVLDIINKDNKYLIKTDKNEFIADIVVLASGSQAFSKLNADNFSYELLKKMHCDIIKPFPALVKIKTLDALKDWDGIRTDVKISLYEDGSLIKEETGEIQLIESGISGICTFNLSGLVNRGLLNGKKEQIKINFLPFLKDYKDAIKFIENQNKKCENLMIITLLERIINYKLAKVILKKIKIKETKKLDELNEYQIIELVKNLTQFEIKPIYNDSFEQAQICGGGLSLLEVDINTLELKKYKNFYVTGEILDVDGQCGGYNLGFAWMSGLKVGKAIK